MQEWGSEEIYTDSVFITDPDRDRRLAVFASRLRVLHATSGARYCRPDRVPGVGGTTVYCALRGASLPRIDRLQPIIHAWGGNWREFSHLRLWVTEGAQADLSHMDAEGPHWNSDADRWEPCPWNHQVSEHDPLPLPAQLGPSRSRTVWTSDSIDRVKVTRRMAADYEAGASIRTLVKAYRIPYTTVRNALLDAGVTLRSPNGGG